jgi:heme exporter protein CcmD
MNFDLSPYGAFIWPAYIVSALALGGLTLWASLRWRDAKAKLAALERGQEKREAAFRPDPRPNQEAKP